MRACFLAGDSWTSGSGLRPGDVMVVCEGLEGLDGKKFG